MQSYLLTYVAETSKLIGIYLQILRKLIIDISSFGSTVAFHLI